MIVMDVEYYRVIVVYKCVYFVYVYLCICVYMCAYVCICMYVCTCLCVFLLFVCVSGECNDICESSTLNTILGMKFANALRENEGGKHPVHKICESSTRNPIRGMKFAKALCENAGGKIFGPFAHRV